MKKLKSILSSTIGHELVTGSFYIFIGTTLASLLAFLLNLFFARNLSYSDYGVLVALFSLIVLFTVPAQSLVAIIVRYATAFFAKNENDRAGALYVKSFKFLLFLGVGFNVIFMLLYPFMSDFLKIEKVGLFLLVGFSITAFYFVTLNLAFIQSLLRFRLLGFIYSASGIIRLILGIVLIILGYNVFGALTTTLIVSLLVFTFSLYPLTKVVKNAGEKLDIGTKEFTMYAIPTSIAIISLSSFISTDVLLVKHFFNPVQAGLYGGLALVGKVIFYFTAPIAIAMFPLIVKRHEKKQKYNNLLYLSMLLVIVPSYPITFIFSLLILFANLKVLSRWPSTTIIISYLISIDDNTLSRFLISLIMVFSCL